MNRMGLLLADKPEGLTSHDVVAVLRRVSGIRKVGHTGTLDPLATGLMGILFGRATALEPYLSKMEKSYETEIVLGLQTDTLDVSGQTLGRHEGPWPSEEAAAAALKSLEGPSRQVPPAYSAIKVGGVKSCQAARRGVELELPARDVSALELKILKINLPFVKIYAKVSSGYYIRSLARDLGRLLGLGGGAVKSLRRLSVGNFQISRAVTLDDVRAWGPWPQEGASPWTEKIISPALALPHLSAIILDEKSALNFRQGKKLWPGRDFALNFEEQPQGGTETAPPYKILDLEGRLLGLACLYEKPSLGGATPLGPYLRPLRVLA